MTVIRSIPWYRRFKENFCHAYKLLEKYELVGMRINRDSLSSFNNETMAQFIFESNNIEKEGLPLGETRRLVLADVKEGDPMFEARRHIEETRDRLKNGISPNIDLLPVIHYQNETIKNEKSSTAQGDLSLIATYGVQSKDAETVLQHLLGIRIAEIQALNAQTHDLKHAVFNMYSYDANSSNPKRVKAGLANLARDFPKGKPKKNFAFISEDVIKRIHKEMANGLMEVNESPAGEYRNHPIMTDLNTNYPAWQAIPEAMDVFVNQYRAYEKEKINPIFLASWASTRLVAIHPFSNFNGRTSRLIMNMIFRRYNIPFWLSLRSTARERKKYFTALRHSHRNNLFDITTLISSQIIDKFSRLNEVLAYSAYPQVLPEKSEFEFTGLNDDQLLHKKWKTLDDLAIESLKH